jgi:hypothetical protein
VLRAGSTDEKSQGTILKGSGTGDKMLNGDHEKSNHRQIIFQETGCCMANILH